MSMYVAFLAGGIASGKSSVARELGRLGAWRIDLDQLSREVLAPGTTTACAVARVFGADLLDTRTGELDRRLLAQRAFATPEATARLEDMELPAIRERLAALLAAGPNEPLAGGPDARACPVEPLAVGPDAHAPAKPLAGASAKPAHPASPMCPTCCVVEVPLLNRAGGMLELADEVVAVCCPAPERLRRAVARGMEPADAAARMARQPTDEWLRAHSDTIIENVGAQAELRAAARSWWNARSAAGWASPRR